MKISILVDNKPGKNTAAEHGLSYLIEYDNKKILFDTGQSNLFLKNAQIMNIDLSNIDMIILSHGHFDHGNGLQYLNNADLISHPGSFVKRYRKLNNSYIGLKNTKEELSKKFNLILSKKPYQISNKIVFLGEIPRLTDFEAKQTNFILENGEPDFIIDDSGIALRSEKGLFIITGCGHAGIVNTLEHAKNISNTNKIYGIMGGFHLKKADLQTKKTIEYLKANQAKHVYPSHCTEQTALELFFENFGERIIKTGDIISV